MNNGQVLVEALIGLTLLLVAALLLTDYVMPAAHSNHQQLVVNREAIWSRQPDLTQLDVSDDYASAKVTGRLLGQLDRLVTLDVETNNLHLSSDPAAGQAMLYPMARITDAWSAETSSALASRPAMLVTNSLLSNGLVKLIQNGIGWLPIAKEVRSSSLKFGHIDTDVVPPQALKP